MARFYGTVQGNRGSATRLGHAKDGLRTEADTWDGGVQVNLIVDDAGRDIAEVLLTPGSGGSGPMVRLYRGPIDTDTRWAMQEEAIKSELA